MIKINLLGDETVIDTSGVWVVLSYALSLLVLFGLGAFLYYSSITKINDLTTEQADMERRLASLQETTKEVRQLEAKKKELAEKTAIINKLKRSKLGPVRVLDDLNQAVPEKAWVTDLHETGGIMRITGYALDNQTIAAFMKALERSNYYESIDLVETKQASKGGVKIKEFTLQTKLIYAGKALEVVSSVSPSPTASAAATGEGATAGEASSAAAANPQSSPAATPGSAEALPSVSLAAVSPSVSPIPANP